MLNLLVATGMLKRATVDPGTPGDIVTPASRTIVIPGPDGRTVQASR